MSKRKTTITIKPKPAKPAGQSNPVTDDQILQKLYYEEGNYFGRDKLWRLVRERYPDSKMSRAYLMSWLKRQELHQLYAPTRATRNVRRTLLSAPMTQIGIDLVDMSTQEYNGYKWLLTGIDLFSKYLWVVPIKDKTERSVAEAFSKMLAQMPSVPKTVRSDNGSEFISKGFKAFCEKKGIKQIFATAGKPQSNGQIERANGILKRGLSMHKTMTGSQDWVAFLPKFVTNYNNSYQRVIKMTPAQAMKGDDNSKVKENIKQEITSKNERLGGKKFEVGDRVRLKLENIDLSKGVVQGGTNYSREIYTIRSKSRPSPVTEVSYRVKNDKGENQSDVLYANDMVLVPAVENEVKKEETFIVQRIIRPSAQKGKQGYIVKWKGYTDADNTWQARELLMEDIPKTVQAFDRKHDVQWTKTKKGTFTFKWNKNA